MNTLTTILILFSLSWAKPAMAQLNENYIFQSLAPYAFHTAPLCPDDVECVINGTEVILEYIVQCYEQEVSFQFEAIKKDEQIHLFVNLVTARPNGGFSCLAFSSQEKYISLPRLEGEVIIHALGVNSFDGSSRPGNY